VIGIVEPGHRLNIMKDLEEDRISGVHVRIQSFTLYCTPL